MSMTVSPDTLTSAAGDLIRLADSLAEANAALGATTSILPAAADEVSAAIAGLFGAVGQQWQELASQAQAFQSGFVQNLLSSAEEYVHAEVVNRGAVGLGVNFLSVQTGRGFAVTVSSSVPLNVLLDLTNTGIPVVGPLLDYWAMHFAVRGSAG